MSCNIAVISVVQQSVYIFNQIQMEMGFLAFSAVSHSERL